MEYLKKISVFIQQSRWARHLLFWGAIIIIYIPVGLVDGDPIGAVLILSACAHVPQMLAAYFLSYFLIPKFMMKKKYVLSAILFILSTYLFSALARILTVHVGEELVRQRPFIQEPILEILTDIRKLLTHYVPLIYSVAFQFLFVKYFLNFKQAKDNALLLSKEKTEAELKILKAQLNPHFLFNTLNNIYSLSLDNSPKTSTAIGKLSDILDHILYKCNTEFVSLSSEITLLNNYIELEKLRYDERLKIKLETTIENDMQIPPLILLSLVENAFKHGAAEDSGSPQISIMIVQKATQLTVEISNTVSKDYTSKNKTSIGLTNIKKQLDLVYNANYSLTINSVSNFFKVTLQIN